MESILSKMNFLLQVMATVFLTILSISHVDKQEYGNPQMLCANCIITVVAKKKHLDFLVV